MNKAKKLAMGFMIFSDYDVEIEVENSCGNTRIYVTSKNFNINFDEESAILEKYGWWKNLSNQWVFDIDE